MKVKFKVLIFVLFFSIIYLFTNGMIVNAHTNVLDVDYDPCTQSIFGDGDDEVWYYHSLSSSRKFNNVEYTFQLHYHISHNVNTITYFINNTAKEDSSYTWSTDISEDEALRIRNTYISSMLRWNDVYFYSYDEFGVRTSNKIINIVETNNRDSANIIIYPTSIPGSSTLASTAPTSTSDIIEQSLNTPSDPANYVHAHYDKWEMHVNISQYNESSSNYNIISEFTGQHEMGHVLGLRDVDNLCVYDFAHHSEILMGYGISTSIHTPHVTYKDIAGISIIREFHTDIDHTWMKRTNDDSTIDLICAQCNGVLYDVDMDSNGITYQGQNVNIYKDCIHHSGTTSNLLLVATDGERNFFKCQNCRNIETIEISEEFSLSNYSSTINKTINLSGNETKYYKINSNYNKYYEFMVDGTYGVDIKLFDENFNEILVDDLNDSNSIEHIINQLQGGTYYLEIKNSSSSTNSTSIKIVSRTTTYLECGDNDILVNTYNNIDEYNFINSWGAGFYKFTVDAITSNDFIITYPNEALKIYDNNNEYQEDKYNVEGYSQDAENLSGVNYLYMYLERDGYYYIHIDLPNLDYSKVILNIERVSVDEIDVDGRCDEEFIELLVNSNNMTEYAVGFSIDQTATFDLTATTSETYSGNITLVLFRKEYNSNTQSYYKTDILGDYLSIVNERLILEEGTYYIGFFGNTDNVSVTVTIDRIVVTSEIIDQVLVMDPSYALPYGTEVRHNGGGLGGTTITEGFTRHVHFQNIAGVPSVERKDYNFYSSNTSYATVSEFGTVFAKSVSQDCEVTIIAVYKYNPAIIFTIDLVIKNDTTNTSKVIESTQTIKLSDFVDGKYKLLLYEQNSPYPWIQYFNWSIFVPCQETEILVTMDQYGFLITSGTGSAILTGEYIINPNVTIVINIIFK